MTPQEIFNAHWSGRRGLRSSHSDSGAERANPARVRARSEVPVHLRGRDLGLRRRCVERGSPDSVVPSLWAFTNREGVREGEAQPAASDALSAPQNAVNT
jgi:hypothetical protein